MGEKICAFTGLFAAGIYLGMQIFTVPGKVYKRMFWCDFMMIVSPFICLDQK